MRRKLKRIGIIAAFVAICWGIIIITDHKKLENELIRLHIIANSDSEEDQNVKLRVRDAVLESLEEGIQDATDVEEAKQYLITMLPKLEEKANQVLEKAGFDERVSICLDLEEFPKRIYDTFALPAGIYQSLRVAIGEAEGNNWWCVVFPQLCLPAAGEDFDSEAVDAGLSQHLADTLKGDQAYRLHFYALDLWGKLENLLFSN